jgi:hypothetical protein
LRRAARVTIGRRKGSNLDAESNAAPVFAVCAQEHSSISSSAFALGGVGQAVEKCRTSFFPGELIS